LQLFQDLHRVWNMVVAEQDNHLCEPSQQVFCLSAGYYRRLWTTDRENARLYWPLGAQGAPLVAYHLDS
jgi:hypothetical protein